MDKLAIQLIQDGYTNIHYQGSSIVVYFWSSKGTEHWFSIVNHDVQGFNVYDDEEVLLLQAVHEETIMEFLGQFD